VDEVQNTLHFYQRRPPAVTIGYSLDAATEVDIDFCAREGIDVVRRLSGGGAIYTDDRQLVFSLTTRDVLPFSVEESLKVVCTAVAGAISSLGVEAVFAPMNDVLINGQRKRIWPLKYHPDILTQRYQIRSWIQDILIIDQNFAFRPHAFDQIVHAVKDPQHG